MSRKAEESIGKKFGRLTVVQLLTFDKFRNRKVLCVCDCGKDKIVTLTRLRTGNVQSCGCLRIENANKQLEGASKVNPRLLERQEPRLATAKLIYNNRYSDGNLSFEEFLTLSQQNCFYCGIDPSNTTNYYLHYPTRYSKERQLKGYFTYNGLDRIDSFLPHNVKNVVPCCLTCNKAKLQQSPKEFFDWITKVYNLHCFNK